MVDVQWPSPFSGIPGFHRSAAWVFSPFLRGGEDATKGPREHRLRGCARGPSKRPHRSRPLQPPAIRGKAWPPDRDSLAPADVQCLMYHRFLSARVNNPPLPCPSCPDGVLELVPEVLRYEGVKLGTFIVEKCPVCGERLIEGDNARALDRAIDEAWKAGTLPRTRSRQSSRARPHSAKMAARAPQKTKARKGKGNARSARPARTAAGR